MESKKYKRDEKGDIIFPKIKEDFFIELNKSRWTYVFHFKKPDGFFSEVVYEKFPVEDMRTDLPKFELEEFKLFKTDIPASDEQLSRRNLYNVFLNEFFTPIFKVGMRELDDLEIDIFKLVIPKERLKKICDFIQICGLENYKDFILFLIAKIEQIYVRDVEFYDRPEQRKIIKEFPNEVKKLHRILKISECDYSYSKTEKPILEQIVFHYNTESIKINDDSLLSNINDSTIEYYNNGARKNWEKQLLSFPNVYDENQLPNQFRHRLCNVLHSFFKGVNAFKFDNKKTTDLEIEVIARILDFANVKFHNKNDEEFDIDIDLSSIRSHIRNAIKRKKLIIEDSNLSPKDFEIDLDKLNKYFDKEFIDIGNIDYNNHDLKDVCNITDRYEINNAVLYLLYIFSCLQKKRVQIGHQFELLFNKEIENNTDYQSWKKIIELLKSKKKISEINFKIEHDDNSHSLQERLSFELVEQALLEYYEKHSFEFEIDFYESHVDFNKTNGSFKLITTGKLHEPQNRFLALFCKQCYQFLKSEFPPTEKEWNPSKKYFSIIGLLLIHSLILKHNRWDEEFVFKKVEYWYNL